MTGERKDLKDFWNIIVETIIVIFLTVMGLFIGLLYKLGRKKEKEREVMNELRSLWSEDED